MGQVDSDSVCKNMVCFLFDTICGYIDGCRTPEPISHLFVESVPNGAMRDCIVISFV